MIARIVQVLLVICMITATTNAQAPSSTAKPLAVVHGEEITEEMVKKAAGEELEMLELKKFQSDLQFRYEEHSIYQRTLDSVVEKILIETKARNHGTTPNALTAAEIDNKVPLPDEREVSGFWEANRERINLPVDEARRQIRAYLTAQHRENIYKKYVEKLRVDYNVVSFMQPFRVPVQTEGFPAKGPASARVTIVEFSDFECPYCAAIFPTLREIQKSYGDSVRVVYRQFPLTKLHMHAQKAAEASLCAFEQQKFWEMHDAMFQDNRNLDTSSLKEKASALMLDTTTFSACLDSGKYASLIAREINEAAKIGVRATPTLFINGRYMDGVHSYGDLAKIIGDELQQTPKEK